MNTSILRALSAWADRRGDLLAVACRDTQLTWRELDSAATRAALELARQHGVGRGDRVAVLGRPTTEWVVTALGVLKLGAVICPLNERSGPVDLAHAVAQTEPTVIVASAALASGVTDLGVPITDLDRLGRGEPSSEDLAIAAVDGADPVAILSTSGSTGAPKGVVFTHESLASSFFEWCLSEPTFLHARALSVSSMAFGAGLLNGFLGPLVLGGSIIYLPDWDPAVALALIRDHRVNHLGATTVFYEQMADHPDFDGADLSSLTIAFTGGNPVTDDLIRRWGAKGIGLRQAYGLTESQSHATIPTVADAMVHPDSVGIGGVLNEFHICHDDGTVCGPDQPGEIVISGPGMAAGYWRDPDLTATTFGGGRLRTGDIGVRDTDGRIRVIGRTKDIIISGGINIYAAELERAIAELPEVAEIAVIGVSDSEFGETPAALIRVADGAELTAAAVVQHCRDRLSPYKAPRYVEFLDRPLPRTAGMKIRKGDLRTEFADLPMRGTRIGTVPSR
ncbi:class I adenylate-forming enzyme family protein [Gordonia hydrophobica]|uniref:Class I adenylate-forming enzyme family protein n=1 Tax=Gordonia hydrophobica TaxID=40516 RepID=A0ABZ2U460_9ACTN|nr:class I adenylate-forming enzyme family protein [Gordonia hydrophobica]MBM7367385.1 fatty-acyl-CoA synthase [Gordonia hydrophobica]